MKLNTSIDETTLGFYRLEASIADTTLAEKAAIKRARLSFHVLSREGPFWWRNVTAWRLLHMGWWRDYGSFARADAAKQELRKAFFNFEKLVAGATKLGQTERATGIDHAVTDL